MTEGKPRFDKCFECGNDTFKVRVTPYGSCGSDTEWVCAKCGTEQGGIFNDPLGEIPPEIFGPLSEGMPAIPNELKTVETLKMLKALDHPLRWQIVNFILSAKPRGGEE